MRANLQLGIPNSTRYDATLDRMQQAKAQAASEKDRLRSVAGEFEALLTEQLVSTMRKTVPESVFFNSIGVKLFNEMLDGEFVRLMTERGGIGLREFLTEGFVKAQGLPDRQD